MAEVTFGEWLKRQRGAQGWTQKQLAQQINCSLSALRKFESEERHPSPEIVERLAEIFNIPQEERKAFLRYARGDWQTISGWNQEEAPWRAKKQTEGIDSSLPSGTVTFLFTDIEGSTKLAQQYPKEMPALLIRHHEILNQTIKSHEGYAFQVVGDSFLASFHSALDAINAALAAQRLFKNETWSPAPIKVRMGIHTGTAHLNDTSAPTVYSSYAMLAATQRIMSAGHGGQILLSGTTRELILDVLPADTKLVDLGRKRLKNLLRPEHLYQLNASGLPTTFPPLQSIDLFPNNLPIQLTSFIGREKEITEIKQTMKEHRLVTLTGSGGTGKTRLSLKVAADLLDQFEHGVWLVELAPLTDPVLIPRTILSVIGINEQQGREPLDLLREYLLTKNALIILDNCEHLLEACAEVTDVLLSAAPKLSILTSSREPLGVRGEASYAVPSLETPDPRQMPGFERLSHYEALDLFVDRARLILPQFKMDRDNATLIAQICHRLDGIPLAIELAATRIKILPVEQISKRLDDRFRLLTGGARTALPRQQTLRATIDWSYELLSNNERLLLNRLSVFAGGWTIESAEEVCAGDGINSYDVLEMLSQLVNKSLAIVINEAKSNETRYRLLETIRQYAREKLLESGSGEEIRVRYFDYYYQMVKRASLEFYSPKELTWLVWFENEWGNLHSVVEWSIDNRPGSGLKLVNHLSHFLMDNWHVSDIESWLSHLISHPENSARTTSRAHGLFNWAHSIFMGASGEDVSSAESMIKDGLSISEELGDKNSIAWGLMLGGSRSAWLGNPEDGGSMLLKGLKLSRETKDKSVLAHILRYLVNTLLPQETVQRNAYLQESLSLYRELGHISGIIEVLKQLGATELRLGRFEAAHTYLDEALLILQNHSESIGNSKTVSFDLGDLAYFEGNYEEAQKHFEDSLLWAENVASTVSIGYAKVRLGHLYLRLEDEISAIRFFQESLSCFQTIGSIHGITYTLEGYANLFVFKRQWKKAVLLFSYATKQYEQIHGSRPPVEQIAVESDLEIIHSNVDNKTFERLWEEGYSMKTGQAIELAMENSYE